jgi:tetratricopeptide (TPR) repeat protein
MRLDIIARRGQALESLGREAEAIAEYRRAIAAAPKGYHLTVELYARIVGIHRRQQRLPALLAELEKAWPVASRGHFEWSLIGKLLEETGSQDEAIKAFQTAVAKAPTELETQRRLLVLLENTGRDADALAQLKIIVGIAPGEARFGIDYIERLFRAKDTAKAVEHSSKMEARFSRDAGVLSALADLHFRWGQDKHAEELYERIKKLPP